MRTIFLMCLLLAAAACTRWQPVRPVPVPSADAAPVAMRSARVTPRETGRMAVLHRVEVTADSVTGWTEGAPDPSGLLRGSGQRVAYARDQVLLLERAEYNPWGVLASTLAALGFWALYAYASVEV